MTDTERTEHALEFLLSLSDCSEQEIHALMNDGLGTLMVAGLAEYAESTTAHSVKTLGDAKGVAKAMIMVGYLLRVEEEKISSQSAALRACGGFRQ